MDIPQPQYVWHEPSLSWKTQEEFDQLCIEEQKEFERLEQEELLRQQEEEQKEIRWQYEELHKKFVYLNEDGIILEIIIASQEFIDTKPFGDGIYIQNTDEIKREPMIGGIYDKKLNAFLPIKTHESWIINPETYQWEPPTKPPAINEPSPGKIYVPEYNAYILPPPDQSWEFNKETLEWEPPTT